MSDVLQKILATKKTEVARGQARISLSALRSTAEARQDQRDFVASLERCIGSGRTGVIAEIKKASPSKGLLRAVFEPADIAARYEKNGAACLSVLTDEHYFQGSSDDLVAARGACRLPVLRKDFMVDPWQIYEASFLSADAILLIVAALDDHQLADFEALALSLRLSVLVEVHDERELERAMRLRSPLLGINNRDLRTFHTSIETTGRLAPMASGKRIVSESGIQSSADVERLHDLGVDAVLVGETFMRADDPGLALASIIRMGPGQPG